MKKLLALLAALLAISAAQAIPINYTYIGDLYMDVNHPEILGFSFEDRLTISLVLDSFLWGEEAFVNRISFESGPYSVGDVGDLTTDLFGLPVSWRLGLLGRDLRMFSIGFLDGSGYDLTFTDQPSSFSFIAYGRVDYPAGSPSRWTMEALNVPDAGSTMLLLSLAFVPILAWRMRIHA